MVHMCKMMISPEVSFVVVEILIFWAVFDFGFDFWAVKGQKYPKMKNKSYICYVPYLRNSMTYDHDFWYTFVK